MKLKLLLVNLVLLLGLGLAVSPLVMGFMSTKDSLSTIDSYNTAVEDSKYLKGEIEKAKGYNTAVYNINRGIAPDSKIMADYNDILNLTGSGIMGSIEIPSIMVNLPIYHGTSDLVLNSGIGHIEGTSLPVGGTNTRSFLTGHTGSTNAKLFTRLDELVKGDKFYINLGNGYLAYEVVDIEVMLPEEVENLKIEDGKDLVSLITCTPYGVNSHRLVVTGSRVDFDKTVKDSISKKYIVAKDDLVLISIIGGLLVVIVLINFILIKSAKRVKSNKDKEVGSGV